MTGPALLLCPADRLAEVLKAAAVADGVIIDLQGSADPALREAARAALLAEAPRLHPPTTIVRVNPMGSTDSQRDVSAVRAAGLTTVLLPHTESAEQCEALTGLHVIAQVETQRGGEAADSIAAAVNCVGMTVMTAAPGDTEQAAVVDRVLSAAQAAGVSAIAVVPLDLDLDPDREDDELRLAATTAYAAGFTAVVVASARHADIAQAAFADIPHEPYSNDGEPDD